MGNDLDKQLEAVHGVMFDSPGLFFIKDCAGRYLYLNKNMLANTSYVQMERMLGKTDLDTPWEEYAALYSQADKQVIHNKTLLKKRELIKTQDKTVIPLITQKKPFYLGDKLIGVCGVSLEIPELSLCKNIVFSEKLQFFDFSRRIELELTSRQREILLWVIRGYSPKAIADQLNISLRTVQNHMNAIKDVNKYRSTKDILLNVYPI